MIDFYEHSDTTTTVAWWALNLLSLPSSGGFICLQRSKSNWDTASSTDQKQHRCSQKRPFFSVFFIPHVTFTHVKVSRLCRADFPQSTATALLLSSDAPINDSLPTATANRVRERDLNISHVTIWCTPVWWRASKGAKKKSFVDLSHNVSPFPGVSCRREPRQGTKSTLTPRRNSPAVQ